ncbi:sigma-70 family RNA polymerase sigma factor [Prauserella marina]|uniref:sigma-70 family RNA polymerase sigma factor n=1 Tax=Prauserella marina TaxID=530584 RepID=UPI001FEA351A|nr:sigma-70 family RNA polymerase sigma factor [Prauserella marina]
MTDGRHPEAPSRLRYRPEAITRHRLNATVLSDQGNADRDRLDELAAAAVTGDRDATEQLLCHLRPIIVRYCRARIGRGSGNFGTADDVAQDACLGIFLALPHYQARSTGSFRAFAYRIAANKVVDHYRREISRRETSLDALPGSVDPEEAGADPVQRCLDRELSGYVDQLLHRVSPKERDVLIFRLLVGMSGDETAKALSMTPGAVRVAQHRALGKLRKVVVRDAPGPRIR